MGGSGLLAGRSAARTQRLGTSSGRDAPMRGNAMPSLGGRSCAGAKMQARDSAQKGSLAAR